MQTELTREQIWELAHFSPAGKKIPDWIRPEVNYLSWLAKQYLEKVPE